jgi:hypothetical protein
VRRAAALALLVIAASWWAATPVSAHGGEGVLALESFVPAGGADGPGRWDVAVRLTFAEDGHAVDEATVTVAGEDGAGTPLTPVALAPRGDGRFSGVVELVPGVWNLRVVSVEPPAQLALEPVTVSAPGPTSTAPSTDASTSAAPSTSVPPSTSAAPAEVAAEEDDGAAGSDLPWPLLVAVVAVGGVLLAVAVRAGMRHRAGADRLPPG